MRARWQGICLWAVLFGSFASLVHAANPEDEYRKLIRVNENIQPLGGHPFGENISLFDGGLSFDQTDISLQGDGPTLKLTRHFEVYGDLPKYGKAEPVFADWELEVPRLETLTAGAQPSADYPNGIRMWDYSASGQLQGINGWQTDNTAGTDGNPAADVNARCTNFTPPPSVVARMGDPSLQFWDPVDWWKGYHLLVPGEGERSILFNADASTSATYPAVTKDHWRFSCLPTTANGQPGEGFLGHAPDGTLYWFNYLVYRKAEGMSRQLDSSDASLLPRQSFQQLVDRSIEGLISLLSGSSIAHAVPISDGITRSLGVLLVTKVQDRFGNTLTYSYDANGYLTGIQASDGRALSVTYVSGTTLVQSVTLQPASGSPRTWVYTYSTDNLHLIDVQLPDNSHWTYNLAGLQSPILRGGTGLSSCETLRVPGDLSPVIGTITHPSGLVGQFTVQGIKHGRSFVPEACRDTYAGDPNSQGSYSTFPKAWYSFTTTQVTFSGAGIPTRTWSYNYSPSNDSWSTCTGSCPTTVWTDVVAPDGSTQRSTFSNRFDVTEGQLLRVDDYSGAPGSSTLLRSQLNSYTPPTTAPLPTVAGYIGMLNVNRDQLQLYSPLNLRVINQDGDTYTWQAEAFNSYAQATQVKRYSSIAGQAAVEEQTDYLNDATLWVLGLPAQITNLTTGEVVDKNVYNSSNDTLAERWHFGQKLMSYSFNAQGQLASFTDGNGHTTTLGNYKRGIPQAIGYPDGTSQSLVVDDFGQIQSITDPAGATTSYGYDSVGRVTQISYPSGDEQAWYPKTFTYDFVTGAERGVGANHWRRTVAKGIQRQVTYFNAELQPLLTDTYIDGDANSHANIRNDYDFRGLTTFGSYPVAGTPDVSAITAGVTSSYDALGRLTSTQETSELGPLTTSTAYLSGARKQVTDPKGKITVTAYQVFDAPAYDAAVQVQAPGGVIQTITRDLYGDPTAIRQYGNFNGLSGDVTKTLTYDGYHRLCRTTEPESGSEVMAYDDANNLAWSAAGLNLSGSGCGQEQVADAGKTTRSYDAMNRLLALTPPSGTQGSTYAYDALGNLKSAVSGISTWSATRNKLGQMTSETLQLTGQDAWRIGYAHDAYGSLASLTYPDSTTVAYTPDALGRATQVGSYANGIAYFPNGEVASFNYGNGAAYLAEQNARQLLSNFSYGVGSTLNLSEDYSYDANGNITQVADLVDGRRTKAFGYDDLNRLTSATAGNLWGTESYAYDPLNNMRSRIGNGAVFTYNYDALNRLSSITGAGSSSFAYDNRGNVTSRNGNTLQFDQKNQLTQIDGLATYAYDAAGRRVAKTLANGSPTYYFYTQAGQLLYQWDTGTATTTNFIYLGRKLVARDENLKLIPPAGISFDANPNNGTYTVNWSAVVGAINYTVQESVNSGAWTTVYSGSATSVALSGRAGGSYQYQVRACADSTCTGWTGSATLGVRPVLPTVTVPSGTINGTYTVSWSAPASATAYDVQEQANGGGWTTIASGTIATSISRPGTTSGSYIYQVSARNAYGSRGWAASSTVTVDTTYGVVPATPASLTVPASSTNGSATLSWNASSLATRYVVQQSSNGGTNWSGAYDGSSTSVGVSGLADGSYLYQVQACNTYGCSGWRAGSATLVVLHPPSTAPIVSTPASSSTGSYTVTWSGVPGQVSYTLQEALNGGAWSTVQTAGNTSWVASGRGNGSYGYRVQACNSSGCGPWSAMGTTVVTLPPAGAPAISTPSSNNTGGYTVSWTIVSTATSYTLQEQTNGGAWVTLQTSSGNTFAISGKANGTYGYRVEACNGAGCSAWSTTAATVVTLPPGITTISAPTGSNTGSYAVSWSAVSTATSYNLQEQVNGGGWITTYSGAGTSISISGKSDGTYGYHAQACNAGGCGGWSTLVTVSVALPPVPPPNVVLIDTISGRTESYAAKWDAVANATRYEMSRNGNVFYSGTATTIGLESGSAGYEPKNVYQLRACNAVGCSAWERVL